MISTTEKPIPPVSVPIADYDSARLDVPIEWMRFCYVCDGDKPFVAYGVCSNGLVGTCSGCGDERVTPFTRVNSEVA